MAKKTKSDLISNAEGLLGSSYFYMNTRNGDIPINLEQLNRDSLVILNRALKRGVDEITLKINEDETRVFDNLFCLNLDIDAEGKPYSMKDFLYKDASGSSSISGGERRHSGPRFVEHGE